VFTARSFHRYRPFLVVALAIALMLVVPARGGSGASDEDEQRTKTAAGRGRSDGPTDAGADGLGATTPTSPAGAGAVEGSISDAAGSVGPATTAVRTPSASTGAGVGTPEALAASDCDRATGRIKVPFVYAPPCVVDWPKGADNGGVTSQGVTADAVKIVIYNASFVPGAPPNNQNTVYATWQEVNAAYSRAMRLWGRRIEGTIITQTGSDEVAQRADAVKVASLKPFAVVGFAAADVPIFVTELARRGIVVVGNSSISNAMAQKLAPYVWGHTLHADEHILYNAAVYVGRRLVGETAKWAGQSDYQVRPRSFGLVHPESHDIRIFEDEFARHGGRLAERVGYPGGTANASSQAERARTIVARLKSKGVTSVIADVDFVMLATLTAEATNQQWFPEWIMTAYAGQDITLFAKTFDQLQWRHAFGPAGLPMAGGDLPDFQVFNWYWGGKNSTQGTAIYGSFYFGIHMAGPRLTPQTYGAGMFAMPPVGGAAQGKVLNPQLSYGRWGFTPGDDYNTWDDFTEVWWDPTARGKDSLLQQEQVGNYRYMNGGRRLTTPQWPSTEPNAFDPAGTVVHYDERPPADRLPDYPCDGCPSSQ
jgi:hypothetical protein